MPIEPPTSMGIIRVYYRKRGVNRNFYITSRLGLLSADPVAKMDFWELIPQTDAVR